MHADSLFFARDKVAVQRAIIPLSAGLRVHPMSFVFASADVDTMGTGRGAEVAPGAQVGMLHTGVVITAVQVAKFGRPLFTNCAQVVAVAIRVERAEMVASRLRAQIAVPFLKFPCAIVTHRAQVAAFVSHVAPLEGTQIAVFGGTEIAEVTAVFAVDRAHPGVTSLHFPLSEPLTGDVSAHVVSVPPQIASVSTNIGACSAQRSAVLPYVHAVPPELLPLPGHAGSVSASRIRLQLAQVLLAFGEVVTQIGPELTDTIPVLLHVRTILRHIAVVTTNIGADRARRSRLLLRDSSTCAQRSLT